MTDRTDSSGGSVPQQPGDFSLVLGGPLYQLLRRAHLTGDTLDLARRRVTTFALFTWLPLLVLTALEGLAGRGRVAVPFLLDVEVHIRFLVVVPLLVGAELIVHQRLRYFIKQFLDRGLIPADELTRFKDAVAAAYRLRNSVTAEVILLVCVYIFGVGVVWRYYAVLSAATWYSLPSAGGTSLSWSGAWYCFVSLPLFQFLLIRWYFRLFIWARFLWQVSRISLSVIPTHPDRLGGLGFLPGTAFAFATLLVAHGALLAGMIATRIFHVGASLPEFKIEIAILIVFLLCIVFGPLLVFSPQLAQAKRTGGREYGTFAQHYVREFDTKWLRGGENPETSPLGTGDIQSLADLANSIEVIRSMRIVPVTRDALLQLAAAALAPLVPLMLTMMSLEELAQRLLKILF